MAETPPLPPPAAEVRVLDFWQIYSDAPNAFYKSFADEALARLAERKASVARLESRADWERYRNEARQKLRELVGPLPEKTPLNPRITGVVNKSGFRIEKVIYESRPGFYVTAALYLPESLSGQAPAIVFCSGHTDAGLRGPAYQTMCQNLVKKGFIVLAFDPIGQGERLQYFNPKTRLSDFGNGSSTREHTRAGNQCFLTGSSLARHMIWDGIRSIDYLVSRPEVDPARIGITGRSGGGTQSAYIAAVDERIRAAAPENYLTTFENLLKTRGPQDPEQNFHRGLALGFDQTDLVIARAPQPTLIVATTRDIFSIEGTHALHHEARRAFAALGAADAIAMTVDDAEHTSTRKNREATYAFFRKHLALPGPTADEPAELLGDELRVTESGQVATSLGGETVFTLNRRDAAMLQEKLERRRRDPTNHLAAVRADARRLAGYTPPDAKTQSVVFSGRTARAGYAVEKYLLPVDERYAIPLVAMIPAAPAGSATAAARVVIYLHPDGKAAQSAPGGEIEALVQAGHTVVAPDMLGVGELGPGFMGVPGDNPPRLWYGYVLLGKSMLGRQLADLTRVVRFAEARFGAPRGELAGIARGNLGPLLLHAAALEDAFGRIAVLDSLLTYRSLVETERYFPGYIAGAVPAALTAYDLPDLAAAAAPRNLLIAAPRDAARQAVDATVLERDLEIVRRAYATHSAGGKLSVTDGAGPGAVKDALLQWLR